VSALPIPEDYSMRHLAPVSTLLSISRPPPRLLSNPPALKLSPSAISPRRNLFNPSSIFSSSLPTQLRRLSHVQTSSHSASTIFRAIASVDQYPSFLPFTLSAVVLRRDAHGWPARATLTVGYEPFNMQEDWASVVRCDESRGIIEAKSDDASSPDSIFEVLQTRWQITPAGSQNTHVQLDIDLKFRNIVHDQMFAQVESRVARSVMGAFEKRAQELD
jgi:ribosome-associated toxin RatA of RatAB toxin-antitoxin module